MEFFLEMELNKYSKVITKKGFTTSSPSDAPCHWSKKEDFNKPFIGIASTGYEEIPVICISTTFNRN